MQSLNEDMDELFRRAAEIYPLNTSGADWNKVLQGLHAAEGDLPEDKKKKDYRFLWLLLLLPIGIMIGRYIGNENKVIDANVAKEISTSRPGKTQPIAQPAEIAATRAAENNKKTAATAGTSMDDTNSNNDNGIGSTYQTSIGHLKNSNKTTSEASEWPLTGSSTASPISQEAIAAGEGNNDNTNHSTSNDQSNLNNQLKKEGEDAATTKTLADTQNKATTASASLSTPADTTLAVNHKSKDQPATITQPVNNKGSKDKKAKIFKPRFSYSLVTGPDVSTVKLQRASKIGYSIGLLLGYRAGNKITIEGGVLWDRKNYYTDGKYLDTSRLKLPMHSKVVDAKGYCNMIEIPVNVRYAFITKPSHSWFFSAGLSSYLMQEEDYTLNYQRYNQPYVKDYGYMSSTKDWFSIMNLSIGYQKLLGEKTDISIAPYVKLPLGGVGIGKLPVSSTGLYVSVTRLIK